MEGNNHHWTGWPGAICFHCGCEDPIEIALADGFYDPFTGWVSEEKRQEYLQDEICKVGHSKNCPQCKQE